jgi:8-oxo-dGTP pyrophosphatase MutT (NUDIX family)
MFTPKRLSCGVLILNAQRELLLCHVTGHNHWDLPKGGIHTDESPLQAALRETHEETGLRLPADGLLDLGRFAYRPRKDLHLFATLMPRLDAGTLHCASQFSDAASGRRLPEMDGFAWFALSLAPAQCSAKMAAVLTGKIDLSQLLARLVSPPAAPEPRPAWRNALSRLAPGAQR